MATLQISELYFTAPQKFVKASGPYLLSVSEEYKRSVSEKNLKMNTTNTHMSKLQQLHKLTSVVADTGDIDAIARLKPQDATTNPSLIFKASNLPKFRDSITQLQSDNISPSDACDHFAVEVGSEIVKLIPGRVSTEVDARLSFNTQATINKARKLSAMYAKRGINSDRVLIKIAATWEGIRAAEVLEREGIRCNLTLLFGFSQARACADAGVYLISPFVGRILDWYKANTDLSINTPDDDPGVKSVTKIYNYYKQHGYKTVVMGASFRNVNEIEALAGCDQLTISPDLLEVLDNDGGDLPRRLSPDIERQPAPEKLTESAFRWMLNEDAMATEKLADGIRRFAADQIKLEALFTTD